jgi:Methylase involved in ubiquinone/menaquinone biosynthesis
MDRYEFEINYKNESFYWWFVGRRKLVLSLVGRFFKKRQGVMCLDAGCGTGIVLKDLAKYADPVGMDLSHDALEFSVRRGTKKVVTADLAFNLPFKDESFELVTILGVLCTKYIPDEESVLKELYRVMKKGGILVSDEGAFRVLLSRHNDRVGGTKRYRTKQMRNMVERAGFKILKCSYWNMFIFPLFLAAKIFDKLIPSSGRGLANMELPLPAFMNNFFIKLLEFEAFLISYMKLPFGTSIITVAIKE